MSRMHARAAARWAAGVFALAALVGVDAAVPEAAQAQSTFQMGRFRGRGGTVLARQLERALEDRGLTASDDAPVTITGQVRQRRRALRLELQLTRGDDVDDVEVAGRNPVRLLAAAVEELVPRLEAAPTPAAEPEPEPAAAEPEPTPPAEAAPAVGASEASSTAEERAPARPGGAHPLDSAQDALEVWVGFGVLGRAHSFTEPEGFDDVGSYQLDGAPAPHARLRWFPLFHFTSDPLLGIGIQAGAYGAVGVSTQSQPAEGDPVRDIGTTLSEVWIGLVYRLPLADVLVIEPSVDYAETTFRLAAPGPERLDDVIEPVPDVQYQQIRPRLAMEVNLPLGLMIRAEGAWLGVLSAGRLDDADWFPRSSTTGVEVGGAIGWRFDRWFAARVFLSHSRYISSLDPEPGDPRIAGGALDEWTRGGAELAFILPGTP